MAIWRQPMLKNHTLEINFGKQRIVTAVPRNAEVVDAALWLHQTQPLVL